MSRPYENSVAALRDSIDGEIHSDIATRKIYATDASVYQQTPALVAIPGSNADIARLIRFAARHKTGLIPRAAGTSLAGQVVGSGIIVDVSQLNRILEIDPDAGTAVVQPGLIRDELNLALADHHMFFAPETSTSNRAMIGGMLGNNSCGANSITYGTTREKVIGVTGFLTDGSDVTFGPVNRDQFEQRCRAAGVEGHVYRHVRELLDSEENREKIRTAFPRPEIHRRNTGYALDRLLDSSLFNESDKPFNFCQLIAGSEGTLVFATELKLQCDPLPHGDTTLVCAHFDSVDQAMRSTKIALQYEPQTCELIDHHILEGAMRNLEQRENCSFVDGSPRAILTVGFSDEDQADKPEAFVNQLRSAGLGYAFPVLSSSDVTKFNAVRKSGLGVINSVPGDEKPVTVIEDTAVAIDDLPEYVAAVNELLKIKYGLECVNYGHAGAGEIHFRPVFSLKNRAGVAIFKNIAADVAEVVRRFRGSLSGEHGDGRLRGEFLECMVGAEVFEMFRAIKHAFDPTGIFNPGKIIDTPPMSSDLRFAETTPEIETVLSFDESQGIVRATELCNGAGVCRKTRLSGGTMCPGYMATHNEADTTRARANLLRQSLTDPRNSLRPFDAPEVREILDLCLSCKACKSECPSNVDMAKLKAEFINGQHDLYGVPWRTRIVASIDRLSRIARRVPRLANRLGKGGGLLKRVMGFHPDRSLPELAPTTLRKWFASHTPDENSTGTKGQGSVNFFCDEFTNHFDVDVGIAAIELLERLGWSVSLPDHIESGRAAISAGMLRRAKQIAVHNVKALSKAVTDEMPLVGVEPSALLTFRDEIPDLVNAPLREDAKRLAGHSYLLEEFLMKHFDSIDRSLFTGRRRIIRLHGHCHQKALSSPGATVRMLQLPENFFVRQIPSGCCGMAGSFGYSREHFDLSMEIGELVLFPTIREMDDEEIIAAPGTSCRHQILDGTERVALHPAQILRDAL